MMGIHEIVALLSPASSGIEANNIIRYLCTDSRQISFPEETIFIALTSPRRNGHHFLPAAYERGIRHFIVSEDPIEAEFPGALFVKVPDTLAALQTLAAFHRQKYSLPVIGITGSNGKTIIKEWLYQLLSPDKNICRSPRSYNSQIGVPLSVWQLNSHHQMAIFEAGISTTGEMQKLQAIIRPTLGIFTTLGSAHDEGFCSREEKIHEKWNLFRSCGSVICRIDDELTRKQATKSGLPIISWGVHPEAIYHIHHIKQKEKITVVGLLHETEHFEFSIPFTDDASVENALHVIVACIHLNMPASIIHERLQGLHALHMRLEWKKGINNSLLLNDSYSYDLTSLDIALNQLRQQSGNNKMFAILSDLPGTDGASAYEAVAALLKEKNIAHLFAIGNQMQRFKTFFEAKGIQTNTFDTTEEFISTIDKTIFTNKTILIKGARAFGLERIAHELQFQQHETLLEINLTALSNNLNSYRGILQPGIRLMVMLKAFGYGSTDAELGRWLQHHGVEYLTVAYTDEGVALRNGGVQSAIMVMNPEPASFESLVANRLEPELYSMDILLSFLQFATANALTQYPVHLKLDTGMHRLGFLPAQLTEITKTLTTTNTLRVATVFTHLVASENAAHDSFTQEQAASFERFYTELSLVLPYPFLKHAANTAGIVRHPALHYDMVRLGIGLFGVSEAARNVLKLQTATRLYSTIAQVKLVAAGQTVGYGRNAVMERDSRIATVRIGYADGYRRQLGNGNGFMYLHGQKVPVVGNVCMDMTMLDVTDVPAAVAGDRVEVFGEYITVSELARICQTIPYEIMTGISQRVKRVMVED